MSHYHLYEKQKEFAVLLGETLVSVTGEAGSDEMRFVTESGKTYVMYHSQYCCESVSIDSIVGDLQDLIGNPLLMAEEVSSGDRPADVPVPQYVESETWTFYKLATIKGYVDIRWHGVSNGYYSESVDFALESEA